MTTPADVLNIARSYIGLDETPVNRTKFGAWYGMDGQPWCSMFVSWCLSNAGLPYKVAYCPAGVALWRGRSRLDRTPNPGDVAFYWHANMGRYAHTGLVEAVNRDGSFVTIEGNTNAGGSRSGGGVRRLRRQLAPKTVFGHPVYDGKGGVGPSDPPDTATPPAKRPMIQKGAKGDLVRVLQAALKAAGFDPGPADGDFGPRTDAAVRAFQGAKGLEVDGQVGPRTWAALG